MPWTKHSTPRMLVRRFRFFNHPWSHQPVCMQEFARVVFLVLSSVSCGAIYPPVRPVSLDAIEYLLIRLFRNLSHTNPLISPRRLQQTKFAFTELHNVSIDISVAMIQYVMVQLEQVWLGTKYCTNKVVSAGPLFHD